MRKKINPALGMMLTNCASVFFPPLCAHSGASAIFISF